MLSSSVCSICAVVAYDGTDFHGFQYQVGVPTIQGALEDALLALTHTKVRIVGAGRTDTGVHASGQVIAAKVPWRHSVRNLQQAWNAHLPPTIVLLQASQAPEDFHPRFSAINRTYRYTVYDERSRSDCKPPVKRMPLVERFALYENRPLALNAMQRAAGFLLGEHDFKTFGQPPQGENTWRHVLRADWQVATADVLPIPGDSLRRLVFTVTANAFLRNMVRNLVASLLRVGRGHWMPEDLLLALRACDRSRSAPPAPPNGLVLETVHYPQDIAPF